MPPVTPEISATFCSTIAYNPDAVIAGFADGSLATPKLVCKVDISLVLVEILVVFTDILPVLFSTAKFSKVAVTGGVANGSLGIPRLAVLPILLKLFNCKLPVAS